MSNIHILCVHTHLGTLLPQHACDRVRDGGGPAIRDARAQSCRLPRPPRQGPEQGDGQRNHGIVLGNRALDVFVAAKAACPHAATRPGHRPVLRRCHGNAAVRGRGHGVHNVYRCRRARGQDRAPLPKSKVSGRRCAAQAAHSDEVGCYMSVHI